MARIISGNRINDSSWGLWNQTRQRTVSSKQPFQRRAQYFVSSFVTTRRHVLTQIKPRPLSRSRGAHSSHERELTDFLYRSHR